MTRRTSTRAQAQRVYLELKEAQEKSAPTPDPSPRVAIARGGGEDDLTARIRKLYEDSAVPVREVARVAGVSERTIYKYVAKHRWTRRYRVLPRGEAAARANRGRRWRAYAAFAPVKGAGARFIRREDKGKPFARGLKATDPAGRAQAIARCGTATRLSRAARAAVEAEAATVALGHAHGALQHACKALRGYLDRPKARPRPLPGVPAGPGVRIDARLEHTYFAMAERAVALVEHASTRWERALREQVAAKAGALTVIARRV